MEGGVVLRLGGPAVTEGVVEEPERSLSNDGYRPTGRRGGLRRGPGTTPFWPHCCSLACFS